MLIPSIIISEPDIWIFNFYQLISQVIWKSLKFSKKRFRLTDASLDNLCHEFAMNRTPEQSNKEFFGFMSILNGFFVSEFADRKKDDENEQWAFL